MARWSFVNAFVLLQDVVQFSGSAGIATGDSVTAAMPAAPKRAWVSVAAPTTGTSEARKENSIIVTANADIAIAAPA